MLNCRSICFDHGVTDVCVLNWFCVDVLFAGRGCERVLLCEEFGSLALVIGYLAGTATRQVTCADFPLTFQKHMTELYFLNHE